MLNLKKTALAVLALSSGAVFAGTMGPVCSAVNVTVPCESTAWEFGGKALYLQPTYNGSVAQSAVTLYNANGTQATFGQNPPYSWGFFLEAAYHFSTGNDVNLNWYEINRNSSRSYPAAIPNIEVYTPDAGYTSGNPNWNAVNLEFGQHVDFGDSKSIRFHGGAQYVRLTNNTSSVVNYSHTTTGTVAVTTDYLDTVASKPTYNGFGPRVGADMAYDWGNGLGFYANGAFAVLAGTSKNTTSVFSQHKVVAGAPIIDHNYSANSSSTAIVPEIDTKLGATYTYAMAQGDLTLDAGWMFVNYFNANNVDISGLNPVSSNVGFQGPYLGLTWMGNVV